MPGVAGAIDLHFGINVNCANAGPGRQVADSANRELLDSVSRGECPHELEPPDRHTKVLVNLARSAQDYVEPEKPKYRAFSGTGRTLTGALSATWPQITHPFTWRGLSCRVCD